MYYYRIAGNFCVVQIFAVFEGRAVGAKIKTGENSHAPVFHMQSLWWVWFLGIETRILQSQKYLLRVLEPFRENLHPRKFRLLYSIIFNKKIYLPSSGKGAVLLNISQSTLHCTTCIFISTTVYMTCLLVHSERVGGSIRRDLEWTHFSFSCLSFMRLLCSRQRRP